MNAENFYHFIYKFIALGTSAFQVSDMAYSISIQVSDNVFSASLPMLS